MRTVCGLARLVQRLVGRRGRPVATVPAVRPLAGGRQPLLTDRIGEQRRAGVRLDQVDGTTCGSAVLVALSAWADPAETERLDSAPAGFGRRFDARQKQVHKESTRFWPQALGTSPWGMVGWLRRNAPAAGPYRVRLVDDMHAADVDDALAAAAKALAVGRPVPLLVGSFVPRHYVMALGLDGEAWRVYEPTSGEVRRLDLDLVRRRKLAGVLGFDRLHAVLLPA
ncbi:hypothetical protein WEH80_07180 [Actinomycetes bacterium KLBMP 9759]